MPRLRRIGNLTPEEVRLYRHLFQTAQGFTLLELLVVMTVLGTLAAVVIFAVGAVTGKGAVAACNTDASIVENAVQAHNVESGGSPTVTPALLTSATIPYLQSFPSSTYFAISIDGSGNVFVSAPVGTTPVAFGTPNACDGAGNLAALGSTTTTSSIAQTTTTSTAPAMTTTTLVSNGVAVIPSDDSNNVSGSEILTISNVDSITSLSITIGVVQTSGLKESNMTNNFPGDVKQSHTTAKGIVTYSWTLKVAPVPAGGSDNEVTALWSVKGITHLVSGDTWSVTSTSNGTSMTLSGVY